MVFCILLALLSAQWVVNDKTVLKKTQSPQGVKFAANYPGKTVLAKDGKSCCFS